MADDGPKDEGDILYTRANLLNPLLCAREIARFLHASTPLTLGEPAIKDLATIIARHIIVGSPVK
jgi:hypothetical protein